MMTTSTSVVGQLWDSLLRRLRRRAVQRQQVAAQLDLAGLTR